MNIVRNSADDCITVTADATEADALVAFGFDGDVLFEPNPFGVGYPGYSTLCGYNDTASFVCIADECSALPMNEGEAFVSLLHVMAFAVAFAAVCTAIVLVAKFLAKLVLGFFNSL